MSQVFGVLALARPTFDVPFAEQMKERAFQALEHAGIRTVGSRRLLFDRAATEAELAELLAAQRPDLMLIMQVTFTDATMTSQIARHADLPLAIWAFPEPRIGGRLRLNAYCGLNLAAHALGRAGVEHGWLYADPGASGIAASLRALAAPRARPASRAQFVSAPREPRSEAALARLRGARIAVIGRHPDGFDTCEFDEGILGQLAGVEVSTVALDRLFEHARAADPQRVETVRQSVAASVTGLESVDAEQLDRSFRVFCALEDLQHESGARGLAVRCWPEMFTEYGCAACGPMAMMNEKMVPAACEADVNGSVSQLLLQELAGEPAWMADLVDIDAGDDTAVLWHCGLAPISMRDPQVPAEATIHTNRKMPLLHQFTLKPGRVTLARLSRSRNESKLMIAGAEVIRAPMAYTGCSATIRFDKPAAAVSALIMDEGLEHHFALVYGDQRAPLRAIAAQWKVPLLELA